jgi:hypothetical protein
MEQPRLVLVWEWIGARPLRLDAEAEQRLASRMAEAIVEVFEKQRGDHSEGPNQASLETSAAEGIGR